MIPLRLPLVCQQIAKRLSDNQTSDMQKNRHQTGNLKSSLSDNRPEAFAASFQTSEGEHQHAFPYSHIEESKMSCAHGRQELPCNSWVGKFLRNSGQCLNVKRQVGVLLWEHRGWILRIASLIKIEKQHNPSFLLIHIVDSTFHQKRQI